MQCINLKIAIKNKDGKIIKTKKKKNLIHTLFREHFVCKCNIINSVIVTFGL